MPPGRRGIAEAAGVQKVTPQEKNRMIAFPPAASEAPGAGLVPEMTAGLFEGRELPGGKAGV